MNISHDEATIHLYLDEADELVDLLRSLEDWLGHAGPGTYEEITDFFNGPGNGRLAVAGLAALLANHVCTINRRVKEATP
jgi:hypothetical protein